MQVQRAQKVIMEAIMDNKEFNTMQFHKQDNNIFDIATINKREIFINSKFCENSHELKR